MQQPQGGYERIPAQPQNGLGVAGFVCGLIGLIFAFIPIIGLIAWPLVILGVVMSAVGLNYANTGKANNKGIAVAGLVVSIVGLAICVIWVAAVS